MSASLGISSAYDLTVGVKVNMDEMIYTLPSMDTPLYGGLGSDGFPVLPAYPVDEIEYQWMTEDLLTPRSSISGAAFTTGDTSLTLPSGHRNKFATGDIIRVVQGDQATRKEIIRVVGYSATTATDLLVTRAFAGSTATTIASDSTLIGIGTALAEGSDPENSRMKDRSTDIGYTEIFGPWKLSMSGTEQVVSKYGVANEFTRQLHNRTLEMNVAREQAALYGKAYNSTTLEMRTTGGLDHYITTNEDSTVTELTVANISSRLQATYNLGGSPEFLAANPLALTDLNDEANTSIVRVGLDDTRRGRYSVMTVITEFGEVTVLRDRWIYRQHAFMWSRQNFFRRVLRPFQIERLAKTGDADHVMMLCEEGFQLKGQQHCAKFTNLRDYGTTSH